MTGEALRATSVEERAAGLGAAAERLLQDTSRAREALAASTGLSAPMVAWGARTTLETMAEESLRALADKAHATGGEPISSLSISIGQ